MVRLDSTGVLWMGSSALNSRKDETTSPLARSQPLLAAISNSAKAKLRSVTENPESIERMSGIRLTGRERAVVRSCQRLKTFYVYRVLRMTLTKINV